MIGTGSSGGVGMSGETKPRGSLILVSTPIGNLRDMTVRGIEVLGSVDVVLSEDTRRTRKLLTHYGIKNRLISYHDHNKERVTPGLLERLKSGETMALVSDAGTPGISDPGFYLVRAAVREGISVTVVPGANAVLPALVLSGFATDRFSFEGFMPRKEGEIRRRLQEIATEKRTTILFVSPHRLVRVLRIAERILPDRRMVLVRELTKIHEEVRRGTPLQLLENLREGVTRGEMVLVIEGSGKSSENER